MLSTTPTSDIQQLLNSIVNMQAFTPVSALIGGVLIGLASVILLLANGLILGVSGIVGGLIEYGVKSTSNPDHRWRIAFVIGMGLAAVLYGLAFPLPALQAVANYPLTILAGLLVGYGVRLGSGCTSGHGVCGLSRLSVRSLAATLTFISAGIVTVWLLKAFGLSL